MHHSFPRFQLEKLLIAPLLMTTEEFQTHMVLCHFNEIESSENWVTLDYFPSIVTTLLLHYPLTHPSKTYSEFYYLVTGKFHYK